MSLTSFRSIILLFVLCEGRANAPPCEFCKRGKITQPEKPLSMPEFDFVDSCGYLDSLVGLMLTEDDPQCQNLQALSTYCGCPPPDDSCSFCPDGHRVPHPEKEVPWLTELFDGVIPTCGLAEAYVASLPSTDAACVEAQTLSSYCGCPALPDHCAFCKGEELKEEFYNVELHLREYGGSMLFQGTCELFFEMQYQIEGDDILCDDVKFLTHLCGCNNGLLPYMGTSTKKQQQILAWIPRGVAVIALIASTCVLHHILRSRDKRKKVYNQMMLLIAVFDIVTSLVWLVGTAAVPAQNELTGQPWGIYGASGNDATCTASGFFLQLGLTSIFLNISLTVYFLLIVVYNVRESRLQKLRVWLIGAPLILGFGLAFAVIPFVQTAWSTCQAKTYHIIDNLWSVLLFMTIPVTASTVTIILLLFIIYCKVRRQYQTAAWWSARNIQTVPKSRRRFSFQSETSATTAQAHLQREVFGQCLCYALAFSCTWPVLMFAMYQGVNYDMPFGFWVYVVVVGPMQGLNNGLCYFRPHLKKAFVRCIRHLSTCCKSHSRRIWGGSASLDCPSSGVDDHGQSAAPEFLSLRGASGDGDVIDPAVALANLGMDDESMIERSRAVSFSAFGIIRESNLSCAEHSHQDHEFVDRNSVVP